MFQQAESLWNGLRGRFPAASRIAIELSEEHVTISVKMHGRKTRFYRWYYHAFMDTPAQVLLDHTCNYINVSLEDGPT
jgi:hypothetical protein